MNDLRQPVYLVTGINERYLARAGAYIESMNRNSNVRNAVVTLDFEIPPDYARRYESVRFVPLSSGRVKSPNSNSCLQHGGFLPAVDFLGQEDVIIYTDADIEVQRGFDEDELHALGRYGDDEVGVSFNKSEKDWLCEEARRLGCRVDEKNLLARYPGIEKLHTYNTGVLVANYRTYLRLYGLYNDHWADFEGLFESYAKQQWLLSYLIQRHFEPRMLPAVIHTHGHYPVELRVSPEAGYRFCIDTKPVVLCHAVKHPAEERVRRLEKQIRRQKKQIHWLLFAWIAVSVLWAVLLIRNLL